MTTETRGPAVTNIERGSMGLPITVTDPEQNVTSIEYDPYGNVKTYIDPDNYRSEYQYDDDNNLKWYKDPLGHISTSTFQGPGRITSAIDPLQRTTNYKTDFKARLTEIDDPLHNITRFGYDGNGNLSLMSRKNGVTGITAATFIDSDGEDRIRNLTDPEANISSASYDTLRAVSSNYAPPTCTNCSAQSPRKIFDPFAKVTEMTFDKTGRVKTVKDPSGNLTTIVPDPLGRIAGIIDAETHATDYKYDALSRLTKVTDANSGETGFHYDPQGNLDRLIDAEQHATTFGYDKNGRKTTETRPLQQATGYTYYPSGLLETVTDAKGQIATYSYDDASRLTEISYDDDRTDSFGYDESNNLTSYSKEGISGTIQYDELNRKLTETVNYGPFSKSYSYEYEGFTKKSYTSPEGKLYSYGYDQSDRIRTVTFGGKTIGFEYDKTRLQTITLPNGVTTGYGYKDNGWLESITATKAAETVISRLYGTDKVGNATTISGDLNKSFGYDATYQLTSSGSESFSYDQAGNRTNSGYSHNENNELTATATASYTHDENGNTTTKTVGSQITQFIHNSADRLETVQLPDGRTATYTYDPFGRRIKKAVTPAGGGAADVTYYLYSDEGLIGEYDASGNLKKGYGWIPDGVWGTNPQFQVDNSGSYFYYHNDHLGTPQKMTDEAGTIVWSATYSAFGKATVDVGATVENNLRFPGQYYDTETGLHYNWNRYYDPETGRYTQVDPIGFAARDVNLYRYVGNSPIIHSDPDGRFAQVIIGGVVGGVVGGISTYINDPKATPLAVAKAAGLGFLTGALGGLVGGPVILQAFVGTTIGAVSDGIGQAIGNKDKCGGIWGNMDYTSIVIAGLAGGFGAGSGGLMVKGGAQVVDAALMAGAVTAGTELPLRIIQRQASDGVIQIRSNSYAH